MTQDERDVQSTTFVSHCKLLQFFGHGLIGFLIIILIMYMNVYDVDMRPFRRYIIFTRNMLTCSVYNKTKKFNAFVCEYMCFRFGLEN